MSWVAVAIGGGAIVGGLASMSAADKQADAANNAAGMSLKQYQQTRGDLAPWMNAGQTGLNSLMNLSGMGNGQPLSIPSGMQNPGMPGGQGGQGPQPPNQAQFMRTETRQVPQMQTVNLDGQHTEQRMIMVPQQVQVLDQQAFAQAMQQYQQQVQQFQGQQAQPGQQQVPGQQASGSQQLAGATQNSPLLAPFGLKDFQESPAYQFNLQEGMKAINKGAAARGNYYAPQTMQDMGRFSQGLASNEWGNAYNQYNNNQSNVWNRLFQLSGTGQAAANQTGAFGANATNVAGAAGIMAGNNQAAGIVGAANAINGGIGDYYNNYLTNRIMSQNSVYSRPDSYFDSGPSRRGH